jgi:hypothetical protein
MTVKMVPIPIGHQLYRKHHALDMKIIRHPVLLSDNVSRQRKQFIVKNPITRFQGESPHIDHKNRKIKHNPEKLNTKSTNTRLSHESTPFIPSTSRNVTTEQLPTEALHETQYCRNQYIGETKIT